MVGNRGSGSRADPLCAVGFSLDHGTVTRGRAWLWLVGAVGVAALVYAVTVQIVRPATTAPAEGLVWPLLGVTPLLGIGLFFAAFSDGNEGAYLVLAGSAMAVSSAYEATIDVFPELVYGPRFALLNTIGLAADAVASVAWTSAIATFPDGNVESAWQRRLLGVSWLSLLAVPLLLFGSSTVYTSGWGDFPNGLPNPYYVEGLTWAVPWASGLTLLPLLGLLVFVQRALFADPETRHRLRFLGFTLMSAVVGFGLWTAAVVLRVPESTELSLVISVTVYISLIAIPVAFVHGVFHYGAFGVRTSCRATTALRSLSLLIGLLYACAVAAPAIVLAHELLVGQAVIITVAMALALQPLRSRAEAVVRRHVFGDRDRELSLLVQMGAQLEQTAGLDEVLDELAAAIRDGLRASWTRIRLIDEAGEWSQPLQGRAGVVAGPPAETRELVRGGRRVGRIEVGPKRNGTYASHELDLLSTVAGQAASAVANVALAAQLEQRLGELSASRARLVVAQDDERRRIERDLHDGIQQNVVALIAGLRLARNRLRRGQLGDEELVGLQDQARETLADLREIAHGIHPPVLGDSGLIAAVESRAARYPIPLEVVADPVLRRTRFSPDLEATAYYVVSESLANVAKHARATSARVTLDQQAAGLRLVVADDGRGFDPTTVPGRGGLSNIGDRVSASGGRLTVASTAQGTRVTIDLPIAGEPRDADRPDQATVVGAGYG
jgi:signal transduction histidine kinase